MSNADEIKKLKELLDDGAITIEEYLDQKKAILNPKKNTKKQFQFRKVDFKDIKINPKNKKILYLVVAFIVIFPFRYNLFPSTNSSDLINLLQESNIAYIFSFNTFDGQKQDRNSKGLWGNRYRYTEKVEFEIKNHDRGGQVFLCATKSECDKLYDYFTNLGFLSAQNIFKSSDGKMVMQINDETPSYIVEKFENVIKKIRNVEARSHTCYGSRCFSDEW